METFFYGDLVSAVKDALSLTKCGKKDSGIPDPSWLTSTLGFVPNMSSPERERYRAVCVSEAASLYPVAQVPFLERGSEEGG